jgi:hypothetical protein
LGKRKKELWLADKIGGDRNIKAVKKGGKTTIMKIRGKDLKQVDRFTSLRSVAEINGKVQNEINKRIRRASNFYHLIKSMLYNKYI